MIPYGDGSENSEIESGPSEKQLRNQPQRDRMETPTSKLTPD